MNLGNKIKNLRKKKKLTQQELADKLYVTNKTVSSWESNRTEPDLEMIMKLSEIFDCSLHYLMDESLMKNDIETEIKVKLTKDEYLRIESFLKQEGNFLKETEQKDIYYQPSYRKFLKKGKEEIEEWLRIGLRGNKKILNYKKWYENKYCDEFEVEIDDEKNLEKIFTVLGLEEIVRVFKKRKTYSYLNKYEVALDEVEELGYFVEIEVKEYQHSALEEYEELVNIIKKWGLSLQNIDKRGYPYHLLSSRAIL